MNNIDWNLTWNTMLSWSTLGMAIAIIATAIYAVFQLTNIKKTRCSDLLMRLNQMWDSTEYIYSRKLINTYSKGNTVEESSQNLKKALMSFDKNNSEEFYVIIRVANFFDNLGFLCCENKYISHEDAFKIFGDTAKNYWDLFKRWCNYWQHEMEKPQPEAWIYFEKLSLEPKKKNTFENIKRLFSDIF